MDGFPKILGFFIIHHISDDPWSLLVSFRQLFKLPLLVVQCCDVICEWPHKATMNCYLQRHLRSIHWGETFQCSDCDYKATTKGNLLKHVKCIHRGITYPCPECDFKARDKSKSIHRGELFPCPDCNYRASQKGYLQKHIKTRHRN